jgi:hypothetical protein
VKFKPGDRVSFLNEKGGGIVTKVIDENLVHVTIEDGFEIPVIATNLIRTGTAEMSENIQKAYQRIQDQQQEPEEDEDILPLYISHNDPAQRPDGIYLSMVPEVQENPLTGSLELYLINHTIFEMLFSLFQNHSGNWHGAEYGFIPRESRMFLGTIGRSEIEKWANSLLQTVFFVEGKTDPLPPFAGLLDFKPVKIYKEESFQYESLLRSKAFFVEACKIDDLKKKPIFEEKISKENLMNLQEKMNINQRSEASPAPSPSFLDKHKIDDKIAEVDLHIGELVDNFTNLEKNDLLNVQLEYFRKCLNQAQKEKLVKIIFIHGVGNGKLKTEIVRLLQKIQGIEFYDAPYARYGMGATEVHFYRNK